MSNLLKVGEIYTSEGPVTVTPNSAETGSVTFAVSPPTRISGGLVAPAGAILGATDGGLAIVPQDFLSDPGSGGGSIVKTIQVEAKSDDFAVERHNAAVLSGDPVHDEKWPGSAGSAAHEILHRDTLTLQIRCDSTGDPESPADYFEARAYLQFPIPGGAQSVSSARLVLDILGVVDDVAALERAHGKPVVGGQCVLRAAWVDPMKPWPASIPWRRDIPVAWDAGAWSLSSFPERSPFVSEELELVNPPDPLLASGVLGLMLYIESPTVPPSGRNQVHVASTRFPTDRAIRPKLLLEVVA